MRHHGGGAAVEQAWRGVHWALLMLLCCVLVPARAFALNPIDISPDQGRIEITTLGDLYEGRGDTLQIETAPGADGLTGRMSVAATTPGTNPNWVVFALSNPTDKPIERWLAADRYNVIGSGAVWPDLDARRVETVTPSIGFVPERVKSDRADLFRITLEPGQTITYVAEMSSDRFSRLYLWKPLDYELKVSDRQLFNGVMLGLTGLLAIFLTAIFAANHKLVFPAAALVCWCALAYLCVDFGFFHKLFNMKPEANAVYRAAAESALAASLVVFLHVFLRLALWHGLVRMLISVWLLAQFSLIAVAIVDPRLAATFARLSFVFIGATGAGLILFLAVRGQDRALSLVPTWILFLVWIFGAGVTVTGQLSGDLVSSGLVSGFVLILLLIGFTVTQYAFRSIEPLYGASPSEVQTRSIAVEVSGSAVWEWNARRDEVKVSHVVESWLGLSAGDLNTRTDDFIKHLHPSDRERFRLALFAVQERRDGKLSCEFRIRQADNSYRWFDIEGSGVPGSDPRAFKCIGLLRDITDAKRAHERLMHDAVHDSLTGLPNRELILDRLAVAVQRARAEANVRPTVLTINIDKFTSVNSSLGLVLGDSLLLTIARRLQRHVGPNDTLARLSGDQFAILMLAEQSVPDLAAHAERIRRSLRSPIKIAGQEIVLTGSLGIAIHDGQDTSHEDLLKQAEIAMFRAKRAGADRIEVFSPEMRGDLEEKRAREADLRRAIEANQIRITYRPIVYLPTEELAGFVARPVWDHPTLGAIDPVQYVERDDTSDMIVKLGAYLLGRAARDAAAWEKEYPRSDEPLFVIVNVSCQSLMRQEAVQELRHVLGRNLVPKGTLKVEVSEHVVIDNPEQATELLGVLAAAGAEIVLDEFGTGFSSLPYLEKLPFDAIRIDQALLQATGAEGTGDSVLVRSLVAIAREMGKSIIARGVEAKEDASFLRSIGCEYGEGTYCGTPISDADVANVISTVRRTESKLKPRALFRTKPKRRSATQVAQPQPKRPVANGASPKPSEQGGARAAAGSGARPRQQANRVAAPRPQPAAVPPMPAVMPAMPPQTIATPNAAGMMPPAAPPALAAQGVPQPTPMHIARIADVLPPDDPPPMPPVAPQAMPPQPPPQVMSPPQPMPPGNAMPAAQIPHAPAAGPLPPPQPEVPPQAPLSLHMLAAQLEKGAGGGSGQSADGSGQPQQPQQRPQPDFSGLPPSIAESLARLAGNGRRPTKSETSGT